jgi:hypothetical protein
MRCRTLWHKIAYALACILACAGGLFAFQKPFRQFLSMEAYDNIPLPEDWKEPGEWVFARLMYPQNPEARFGGGRYRRYGQVLDWRSGGTSWTQDYPRADRHFAQALRRLSRVSARSVEQPANPDETDDFYNWPWMNAGEMGDWQLTPEQARVIREYLLRGGFLMFDDFWGPDEYARFEPSMKMIFPDRPVVEIDNANPIFHTVYNLDDRFQVLGQWALRGGFGGMSRRAEGTVAHWLGVLDDKNRVMVAMSFNSDLGDAWEWADSPTYPEKMAGLAIRIGVNYVVYSMSH